MATLAEVLRQAGYVTPQGQVTGPRTDLAQKLKSYVMNIPQNAAQNLANQRADIDAALTMGDKGIQIGDRAAFARQMAEVPNLMGLTAYHGTPHTIKGKFDISKVGTGEGAQAYGHGMYFAENPSVAKEYANKLGQQSPGYEINGVRINPEKGSIEDMAVILANNATGPNAKNPLEYAKNRALELVKQNPKMAEVAKKIEEWQTQGANLKSTGNLYKVDIPDEYIPNMLDWDKPLKDQPTILQNLKTLGQREDLPKGFSSAIESALKRDFDGQDLYQELIKVYKDPATVSKIMTESGFNGIRYLDEGSRSVGKGTSNFVVFEPSEVKILEQNSKPLTRKEIIEQELEKVSK